MHNMRPADYLAALALAGSLLLIAFVTIPRPTLFASSSLHSTILK